jgi:hypothetical protein
MEMVRRQRPHLTWLGDTSFTIMLAIGGLAVRLWLLGAILMSVSRGKRKSSRAQRTLGTACMPVSSAKTSFDISVRHAAHR